MEKQLRDEILAKVRERMLEIEVEMIMQEELLEMLNNTQFQGDQVGEAAMKIEGLKMQIAFNADYLQQLTAKYGENKIEEKEDE